MRSKMVGGEEIKVHELRATIFNKNGANLVSTSDDNPLWNRKDVPKKKFKYEQNQFFRRQWISQNFLVNLQKTPFSIKFLNAKNSNISQGEPRTETSSETTAGHGDPIDGFDPWHLFFLVIAGSALFRDGIRILGTVRLAPLALFPHFFKLAEVAKYNRNHSGPNFLQCFRIQFGAFNGSFLSSKLRLEF